jgi:hypothetical protein
MERNRSNKNASDFWEGNTSFSEEINFRKERLSGSLENDDLGAYLDYCNAMRFTPESIENDVWVQFNNKNRKLRNFRTVFTAAASIMIILGISLFFYLRERNQKLEMQFALIEETFRHTSSELTIEETIESQVLYEDELITIVANDY